MKYLMQINPFKNFEHLKMKNRSYSPVCSGSARQCQGREQCPYGFYLGAAGPVAWNHLRLPPSRSTNKLDAQLVTG